MESVNFDPTLMLTALENVKLAVAASHVPETAVPSKEAVAVVAVMRRLLGATKLPTVRDETDMVPKAHSNVAVVVSFNSDVAWVYSPHLCTKTRRRTRLHYYVATHTCAI